MPTSATSTVCVIGPLVVFVAAVLVAAELLYEVVAAEEASVVGDDEEVLSCAKQSEARPSSGTNHCCIVPQPSTYPSRSVGSFLDAGSMSF